MIGVFEVRKIEEEDWPSVKDILCQRFSEKEAKRRFNNLRKKNRNQECDISVELLGSNIAGFCSKTENRAEILISQDCERLVFTRKLK